ncbi:Prefoldin subunit-domain-containing protein [Hypoxylon sp. FL1857]|nr:Prefoldin subunit-domain-containing protein [Hypoxylon sp. FL1857]
MTSTKDSFLDLERHRQKLEENVKKLSEALDYWKQWKEEYEELRANVEALPPSAGKEERRRAREKFEGELLDEKELATLFDPDDSKKTEQIVSALTNRLEYVTKNVGTLSKQLEDAENKLAAVTVVTNPEPTDEEGFPITEIREELDEDDNVISYSLRRPGDNRPQILETLKKAGITDFEPTTTNGNGLPEVSEDTDDSESGSLKDASSSPAQPIKEPQVEEPPKALDRPSPRPKQSQAEEKSEAKPAAKKKSVTFSEDTKADEPQEKSDTAKRLEEILQKARDQQSIISDPIMPADESPEESSLREDMIRYNKETMEYEMAPIVAELQLEEGSTEDSDDYSDYDEDEEDEDEWGRTKIEVDDDWKLRMLELKERLSNHEFSKNKAPDDDEMFEGFGRISIRHEGQDATNGNTEESVVKPETDDQKPTQDTKKSVRFAQSLDIAEAPAPAPAPRQAQPKQPKRSEVDPVSEVVLERNGGAPKPVTTPATAPTPKKASRFRKARSNEPPIIKAPRALDGTPIAPEKPNFNEQPTPSGPEGQTLANSVLEHEPSLEAKEPDEFDANLLQKQAAEEYYKLRNKLVYQQGGFMKEDENPIQPLDEEEGGPKRMSRFKAARLAKS